MTSRNNLYILPFDHRSSMKRIINSKSSAKVKLAKKIIYDAYLQSKVKGAILVDPEFGLGILRDAKKKGIITCMTLEKSGTKKFILFSRDYKKKIEEIDPDFCKILVKYDSTNQSLNKHNAEKIAKVSSYLKGKKRKLLFEIVILGERNFDLQVKAIRLFKRFGVNPEVWKLEAVDKKNQAKKLQLLVRDYVVLGRGASLNKAINWLKINQKYAIGFAVGRSIFAKPLTELFNKKISKEVAIKRISNNYKKCVGAFKNG